MNALSRLTLAASPLSYSVFFLLIQSWFFILIEDLSNFFYFFYFQSSSEFQFGCEAAAQKRRRFALSLSFNQSSFRLRFGLEWSSPTSSFGYTKSTQNDILITPLSCGTERILVHFSISSGICTPLTLNCLQRPFFFLHPIKFLFYNYILILTLI